MGDGDAAAIEISKNRLDVSDRRCALGRIAVVTQRGIAFQAVKNLRSDKIVARLLT